MKQTRERLGIQGKSEEEADSPGAISDPGSPHAMQVV